jgi:uncharacterized protein
VSPPGGPEPAGAEREAATLAAALRAAGVPVGTGQVITFRRASSLLGDGPDERYWAGRTTLVSDPRHLAVYDRVFRALHPAERSEGGPVPSPTELAPALDAASDRPHVPGAADPPAVAGAVASERERLRHRRFDRATPEELAAISHLLQRLEVAVPHRTVRRTRPGPRGELDLPRTLERSLATDGELVGRAWRTRRRQPRRLVVLLDVSGSMAPYARALLRFGVAARRSADRAAARRVEVFAFGTRLTRLSDDLAARDPDAAIVAAARRVVDWDGGTRIGASLDELVRTWGRRGVLRGSVVVVCSDGLERGDPALLAGAVARLRRHAHRLVWVNPLAGDPRYEPSQRGMAAALPHVDVLLPGHDLASLESLGAVLADLR